MEVINEHDEVIGHADKDEIHPKGLLHRAVHIFIINSQGKLFCRQRSSTKRIYSSYWSTSVGAHVLAGQEYDEVAKQSLQKDLGINCNLKMIGKARVHDRWENELITIYVGYSDEVMNLNSKEIEGGKFLTIEEIKRLTKQKNVTPHLAHSLDIYLKYRGSQRSN